MSRAFQLLVLASALYGQDILYELRFPGASHHEAEVSATFRGVPDGPLDVVISRSSPGRYALHDFARFVYNVRAEDEDGNALPVAHSLLHQWTVSGHRGTVVFRYTLFGDTVGGTYNAIDLTHARLNGPATFVWARGLESRAVRVKLEPPAGMGVPWTVATQLAPAEDGWWTASSRDLLIDSPIEFGSHHIREWTLGDARFRMALHSAADARRVDEIARLCEIVTAETQGVFGSFPKFGNGLYTLLIDYLPYSGRDAMEHRDSAMIHQTLPRDGSSFALLESVSHEFFHAWNVERIRPRSLEPFDLERANMSGELWFAEGFTNYYGPLILKRAGLSDLEWFARDLGETINMVLLSPAPGLFNAVEMSQRAPFHDGALTSALGNEENTFLSYYYLGQSLAAGIDLTIRSRFPGKSLDDWMRAMWLAHPDVDRPYTLQDLQKALGQAVGDAAFAEEIFSRHIRGREAMDYDALFAHAGLLLRKIAPGRPWLGVSRTGASNAGLAILSPSLRGSPAYTAGIDRGDRILAVDGKEIHQQRDWERILESHKPGDQSRVLVEGRGGKRNVGLTWGEVPDMELVPFEQGGRKVTQEIREFRALWLGSKALQPLPKLK